MSIILRRVLAVLVLALASRAPAAADDLFLGSRISGLERGLSGARARLHEAPRRSAWELRRTGSRVRSLAVPPSASGVALERLERDLVDLRHDADRALRSRLMRRTPRASPAVPESYRPPYPEDIRGIERPIGVGKQVVLVQRSLRNTARELAAARHALAARHLARAEGDLARLGHLGGDPTFDALRLEATRLRARLAAP